MPTVNLHIGAPKCASSLIQGLLAEPEVKDFVAAEYLPDVSKIIASHTPVFDAGDYYTLKTLSDIHDLLPKRDIVLSVENLFGMHTHRPNSCLESLKAMQIMFRDFDVRVLMFVRRQDSYIEAIYGQDVKRQETRGFEQYVAEMLLDNLHWDAIAEVYGAFDLTVLPWETEVIKTGGYRDFVDGLFQWLGAKVEVENLPVINPSLTRAGLDIQMLANRTLDKQIAYDLSQWLERRCGKKPGERLGLLDGRDVMPQYRDSNRRLFARWMPMFNGTYYDG